jgi:hypothetical protein
MPLAPEMESGAARRVAISLGRLRAKPGNGGGNPHAQRLGRLAQTIDYAMGFSAHQRY